MKIIKNAAEVDLLVKAATQVGEVYTIHRGESVNFRCQGGFVNLVSGAFTGYNLAREDACWIHQPNAQVFLNNSK